MNIFIICSVRSASDNYKQKLESYTRGLEQQGHSVHLPHRDTDQHAKSIDICSQNMQAIKNADEVHVFYDCGSQGVHFDLGVSFALGKRVVPVEVFPNTVTAGKSFPNLIYEWQQLG